MNNEGKSIWFVSFVWLNQTDQINEIDRIDQINQLSPHQHDRGEQNGQCQ